MIKELKILKEELMAMMSDYPIEVVKDKPANINGDLKIEDNGEKETKISRNNK